MDGADPYSDGILKSPIVIDNVTKKFSIQPFIVGFWDHQGRLRWRRSPTKDIQLIVSLFQRVKG
jgi:hypothetical protein